MIIEILLGVFIVAFIVEMYIIWNLMTKTELLESWVQNFTDRVSQIQSDLNDIDSTGHFESDDEIGTIFEGIKDIVGDLNNFVESEEISE